MSRGFPGQKYGISANAYGSFEFPTVGENIYRKLMWTATSQQLTGRKRTGVGRCVDEC
jgi:hypothetical protein